MDNKLLLVKSITLLYKESLLPGRTENSNDLVRTVLENVKVTDVNLTINQNRDIEAALKRTALEMCENPSEYEYDKNDLLQRLKLNCFNDDNLYESFYQSIDPELSEASLKRSVINSRKSINNHFKEHQIDNILGKAYAEFRHNRDKIKDVNKFTAELISQLEPFQLSVSAKDPGIMTEVDLGDSGEVSKIFENIKASSSGDMVMRLGKQELNNMFQGGLRRGETVLVGALPHNYKTGFTLDIFESLALYNKPKMIDPTKKPLILRVSFEDSTETNIQFIYQTLKERETGEKVILGEQGEVSGASNDEMAAYVKQRLGVNGYEIKLLRVDPTKWTYMHLLNKILELEASGYEIHVLMVDYLGLLPTTGCLVGPMGSDVRDMFRRVRNFCGGSRKILFITPHQLSPAAKQLFRDGRHDFVKELPGKGYYDKCSTIDNEVDIEIFIHIEVIQGVSYLTIQRGKHRIPTIIPPELKYVAYQFHDIGGIPDDINSVNTGMRKAGGKPLGSSDTVNDWGF